MATKIDPRLAALYDEYLKNDKEYEFIDMLYAILDMVEVTLRKKVYNARAAEKRKDGRFEREKMKRKIENYFNAMSPEELIKFQNTPWHEIPEWIREAMPKLVRNPEECNNVRIFGLVNMNERQEEICASRITRYMEKHGLITSNENGTQLHYENFSKICNELGEKFDLPWLPNKKAQRVRITPRDLKNYTQCRVTPKSDKMALLSAVTNLPLYYLSGYRHDEPNASGNPLRKAPLTGKFKKKRSVATA